MNAATPFVLTAEPVTDLSRLDCADHENLKDALHQLRRCSSASDFQRWAQSWGENLCRRAEAFAGFEVADDAALAAAEADAKRAEQSLQDLESIARKVIADFDTAAVDLPDDVVNRLNDIIAPLENAL